MLFKAVRHCSDSGCPNNNNDHPQSQLGTLYYCTRVLDYDTKVSQQIYFKHNVLVKVLFQV